MQIQVSGHHMDVGEALRSHVTGQTEGVVGKYFDRPVDGHVTLTKENHEFQADCAVHLSSGLRLNTQARANDPYVAFDLALDRMEKRLRRYKRRLKSHNGHGKAASPETMPSFVIEAGDVNVEAGEDDQPVIIAEGTTSIPHLSVGDAVMQMDLSEAQFVIFRNGSTGGLNLVYRRQDGNIGWIDASRSETKN